MNTEYPLQLQRLLDDPLRIAREAARQGARVVGYIGNDVPVALIAATGALPVRLRGLAGQATPRADEFLESAHSPEMRAILEQWLGGDLDFLEAVVFPRTDDSAQRAYYYVCELQRRGICAGPRALLYDVANIARPTSSEHTRDSTRRLARDLGVRESSLKSAVERVGRRDTLLADVRARCTLPAPLPGSVAWRIVRASASDWREEFDADTRRWLEQAPTLATPRRLLLAGNAAPDDALHVAIESAGGNAVLELTDSQPVPLSPGGDLLDAIADQFHVRSSPVLAMRQDAGWLVRCARHVGAEGVVLWLIEEDEALPWEVSRQVRSLQGHVPVKLLSRQNWKAGADALREVQAFVGGLESKL
jgi:hypothetical protein